MQPMAVVAKLLSLEMRGSACPKSLIGGVRRETLAGTLIPAPEIWVAGAECGWLRGLGEEKERCAAAKQPRLCG